MRESVRLSDGQAARDTLAIGFAEPAPIVDVYVNVIYYGHAAIWVWTLRERVALRSSPGRSLDLTWYENMAQHFTIRDLAQEFDVSTRTLRFYEEKRLLHPRRNGQNRIFTAADRTRLKLILRGKRLGLTLDESSDIIALYDPATGNTRQLESLLATIRDKRMRLRQQQQDLELMLRDLDEAETRCSAALRESAANLK